MVIALVSLATGVLIGGYLGDGRANSGARLALLLLAIVVFAVAARREAR